MERNSNVFRFQGSNMIVSAKGPNIDRNMNMSTSFRSNLLSSTMNIPRNFEKQSSAASVVSQRSLYYGRDTSPTGSVRSDLQPRNFHQSLYQRGCPQRSVYNGRGGSPVSMRSIGSVRSDLQPRNLHQPLYQRGCPQRSDYSGRGGSPVSMKSIDSSVSLATDIVRAIKNSNLNRYEREMIQQALCRNDRRKYDFRKKAEKRRKMKMYIKNLRNGFGDDSGEQGSNSSISSDDCASTRTGYSHRYDRNYKENIPRSTASLDCRSEDIFGTDNREVYGYSEIDSQNPYHRDTDSYNPVNNYHKDCQLGNIYLSHKNGPTYNGSTLYSQNNSVSGPMNSFSSQKYMNGQANMFSNQRETLNASMCTTKSMQNMTMMSQRDRFRGGFQFSSQRFNKSSTLHEENEQVKGKQFPNKECANNRRNLREDRIDKHSDEDDDIFLDTSVKPKPVAKKSDKKRNFESLGDIPIPAKKKPKTTSNTEKANKQSPKTNDNEKNEFEFVKPQFPIRKSAPAKPKEKLISRSTGAPDIVFNDQEKQKSHSEPVEPASPEPNIEPELSDNTQLTNSDMSMRPSFMKRKLFTQTLDVTEKKNNSSDSLAVDSPQSNIYSALSREKHKTRKLTTSQSLLSRDVNQDDNNLLDLIHKIVPPNQVNSTITANITKSFNSRVSVNKHGDGDDKWDITSLISTCNNESVSETYTDDEIFQVADDKKNNSQGKPVTKQNNIEDKNEVLNDKAENKKTENNKTNKHLKVVLYKIPTGTAPKIQTPVKACPANTVVLTSNNIDDFWNTDVESDYECVETPRRVKQINLQEQTPNCIISPKQNNTEVSATSPLAKMTQTNKIHELNSVSVNKNDTTLVQVLKKQSSKKMPIKTERTTLKKSNGDAKTLKGTKDDEKTLKKTNDDASTLKKTKRSNDITKTLKKLNDDAKTLKKTNIDAIQPGKTDKTRRGTPIITLKTRRQINLSATLETVKKSCLDKKGLSPNKTASIKTKTSPIKNKPNNEKKVTEEKNNRTKHTQKKQNDNQLHINGSKKLKDTPKCQRHSKITKVQNTVGNMNDTVHKILRSRVIDLSSSFNSDQFELTMSRARKSRTPTKRISFSKSKNLLTKTRNKATKA